MEVEASSSLQSLNHFHDFRVFENLLDFLIILNRLHDWIVLHLLLLFCSLLICQVIEMVTAESAEFLKKFAELGVLSILLHSFLRFRAHLSEHLHCGRVLEGCHQTWTLHDLIHEALGHPLTLGLFQVASQVVLNFFEAQVGGWILRLHVGMILNCWCLGRWLGLSRLLLSRPTIEEATLETAEARRLLRLSCRCLCGCSCWLCLCCRRFCHVLN